MILRLLIDPRDNCYVIIQKTGSDRSFDGLVHKYSPQGELLWQYEFDGAAHNLDNLKDSCLDSQGNLYLTFQSLTQHDTYLQSFDLITIKLAQDGEMIWRSHLGTAFTHDAPFGFTLDEQVDALYIVAALDGSGQVLRLDTQTGQVYWRAVFHYLPSNGAWIGEMITDSRGNLYILGGIATQVYIDESWVWRHPRLVLHKLTSQGEVLWRYIHGIEWRAVKIASAGNALYLTGEATARFLPLATRKEGDITSDGIVDDFDLAQVIFMFGSNNPAADVNGDGRVDDFDLSMIIFNFGMGRE